VENPPKFQISILRIFQILIQLFDILALLLNCPTTAETQPGALLCW
jgi:hypothetical protein